MGPGAVPIHFRRVGLVRMCSSPRLPKLLSLLGAPVRRAGIVVALGLLAEAAWAQSMETSNECQTTMNDPCVRTGACSLQGSTWDQVVTVDRADIFDTMGWAGLCDQVHVGLVQGDCQTLPSGDVIVPLSGTSSAFVTNLVGPLSCPNPATEVPVAGAAWWVALGVAVLGVGAVLLRRSRGGEA